MDNREMFGKSGIKRGSEIWDYFDIIFKNLVVMGKKKWKIGSKFKNFWGMEKNMWHNFNNFDESQQEF